MRKFLFSLALFTGGVSQAQDAVMPAVSVRYADVLAMVKAGGELKLAVGVAAPAGYIRVDDAPSQMTNGLWRCWRDEVGVAKMEPGQLASAKFVAQSVSHQVAQPTKLLPYQPFPNVQYYLSGGVSSCQGGNCQRPAVIR